MSSSRFFISRVQSFIGTLIGGFGTSVYLHRKQQNEFHAQIDKSDHVPEKTNASNGRSDHESEINHVNAQLNKIKECKDIIKIEKENLKKCEKYNEIAAGCMFFCPAYFIARNCLKDSKKIALQYKDCMSEVDKSALSRSI